MTVVEGHHAVTPPSGISIWDADPYSIETLLNAVPFYEELRARGPLVYLSKYSVLATGRHAIVREIMDRPDRFVSSRGTGIVDYSVQANWRKPSIILEADQPYHTKTRTAIMKTLTPGTINPFKPMFQADAEALVDSLLKRDSFDAITDLAEEYSVTVFPKAVGLKTMDRRKIIEYGIMTFNANGPNNDLTREWMKRGADTVPYITESCRREALDPRGFGEAVYRQVDSGDITADEAIGLVRAFLAAGMDATIASIGVAIWALAAFPEEYAKLRSNPSLARAAFDEAARLNTPVHHFYRTCIEDTEIGGITVPANAKVMLNAASTNRDRDFWTDPDQYDISRKLTGALTFGHGLHSCVGQMFARAEGEAILQALARKVQKIEIIAPPTWRPNNFVRSIASMPARLIAA